MCNLFNDPLNAGHVGYFQVDVLQTERLGCRPPYLLSLFLGFVPRCYCFKIKNKQHFDYVPYVCTTVRYVLFQIGSCKES